MDPFAKFQQECREEVAAMGGSGDLDRATREWMARANKARYSYHFEWLGRPIIQYPQDIVAMQELIVAVRPDLIIETGIAHGGSLIFSASMLALLDMEDAIRVAGTIDPAKSGRMVLGVDIDIRAHNRAAIEAHPMASRIQMIQGSSVAPEVVSEVARIASGFKRVLLCLDSNHTHDHVLAELHAYASLVSVGSYCVVFDTIIERFPDDGSGSRSWAPGNSPMTALNEFLKARPEFEIDRSIDNKLQISVAPNGYLKRIR
jgi:cephalosporin hydroxylase